MPSSARDPNLWMGAAASRLPPAVVSSTVSSSPMANANTTRGSSARRDAYNVAAPSVSTVAAGSPMPRFIGAVSQTHTTPTLYRDPTTFYSNGSAGRVVAFQLSASQPQAEMGDNGSDSQSVPPLPPPPNLARGDPVREERSLIFQLRGLPFAATREDVETFLSGVAYDQLDIGTLATGESSGNAFVELRDLSAAEALGRLHNTVITVAADAHVGARERPRPRYVEVLDSDAAKREQVLRGDALMAKSALPLWRRSRASGAAPTNASPVYGISTDASQPRQNLPVHQVLPDAFAQQQSHAPAQSGGCYLTTSSMPSVSRPLTVTPHLSSQPIVDVPAYARSTGMSWNGYAQRQPQQSTPQLSPWMMTMPHIIASQAAPVGSSSLLPLVRLPNVEGSDAMRGRNSECVPFYPLSTPMVPQAQDPQPAARSQCTECFLLCFYCSGFSSNGN